jgi:hypothetical protein
MENLPDVDELRERTAPLEMEPEEFRELGHNLIDQLADFLASLRDLPVTPGESSVEDRSWTPPGSDCPTVVGPFSFQWPSPLLGLHHFVCSAHRHAG